MADRARHAFGNLESVEKALQSGAIDASNVMVVCPVCGKATRVAYKVEGDKKVRICKKCNASLEGQKEAKKTATKTTSKAKTKKAKTSEAPAEEK